jgi:hypothetical protein
MAFPVADCDMIVSGSIIAIFASAGSGTMTGAVAAGGSWGFGA